MRRLILLGIFTVLSLPVSCPARTLTQLISDSRILGFDASSARQLFTDQNITDFLNEGQKTAINQTWCLHSNTEISLSANTTYYALPSNFYSVERMTLNGVVINQIIPTALDAQNDQWEGLSGTPYYYFVNFASANMVGFTPWPTVSTGTVSLDYFVQVKDLVNGTDVPFNSVNSLQSFGFALAYYAASKMATLEDRQDLSANYDKKYALAVSQMAAECNALPNFDPKSGGK